MKRFLLMALLCLPLLGAKDGCEDATSSEYQNKFHEGQIVEHVLDGRRGIVIKCKMNTIFDYKVKFARGNNNMYGDPYTFEFCREDELRPWREPND